MAGNTTTNGNAAWTRWALGIVVVIILGLNAWSTTKVWANAIDTSANKAAIASITKQLTRIEDKLDRLAGFPSSTKGDCP